MKIAVIVNKFPALSETFVLNQITGLIDMGHDVRIFAYLNPNEPKVHADFEKYNLAARAHYIPDVPSCKLFCLFKALYLIILNFHKGPCQMLRFIKMFVLRKKGLSLKKLYFLMQFMKAGFDIIQCHYGPLGLVGVFLKNAGIKSRVCTVFHGFDLSRYPLTHGKDIYNELFQKGDQFLPVSDYWKKRLIALNCDENRITVHHMGIDLEKFGYLEKNISPNGLIKILTVGRLTEKKGYEYAIRAISKLIAAGRKIELLIAGTGPLRNDLESLVSKLQIQKNVKFLGPSEHEEVIKLYSGAHLFLLPSIIARDGDMEGIPVVLMEASAAGLPVISTYHSGIPEVVIDGKSGFLVPEKDVDALTEKLEYLIDNPDIWPRMGKCGRRHVEQHYNIKTLNAKLVDIYKSLIQT